MSRYAEGTAVSTEKSRAEIETTLTRYGATAFAYGWEGARASIQFEAKGRRIRFDLPLPDPKAKKYERDGRNSVRSPEKRAAAWEQDCRQAWRALALVIKAKLEAVAAGITEFESEFLANIVLPDGSTVGQQVRPKIALAYEQNDMPKLLPDYQS
jgi:hypothetical protein